MTAYLQTWAEGADTNRGQGRLMHTAGNEFRKRGITGRRKDGTARFALTGLTFTTSGTLDDQTTRTVRRLTDESAQILEALL